jgi:hypothetical protein
MDPLKDSFRALTQEFIGDDEVKTIVDRERNRLDEWIAEHSENDADNRPRRVLGAVETAEPLDASRSIFDDVDL